jgi:RNA polymerase primary sigma factor
VIHLARRYSRVTGTPANDLIQVGYTDGLMEAAKRYDPKIGRFITYAAWWIKQAMFRYIQQNHSIISVPQYLDDKIVRLRKTEAAALTGRNAGLSDTEISDSLEGLKDSSIKNIQAAMNLRFISLSQPIRSGGEDGRTLGDSIKDDTPQILMENFELRKSVRALLDRTRLSEEETDILTMRFGLNGQPSCEYAQIEAKTGKNRAEIIKIETRVLKRLKYAFQELS